MFIDEQVLTQAFIMAGIASGRVFLSPDSSEKVYAVGMGAILADPVGPKWDVGFSPKEGLGIGPGQVEQFSLLFEIPEGATELSWQFLDLPLVELPQSLSEPLPETEGGFGITSMSLTHSELCELAEIMELECR